MAKRGYKLQEFLAHSANVNCLSIGKKNSRLLITGGDDHKVNLWAIGKPTSLMSLCGHTSPVESVAFDSSEVLVVAGASTGVIKLWDLEEAKMIRALTGHRSNTTAVEFHPFGEFFASGSMDTNLKIWDIRKKGCIHTYKGHTKGISTIKFTPDGRWVVSGGFDNVVKVWDLTAGKLLHDFKFHEGHIRSIDFHPLEFLLATGSADRTVKFWDLETFELIGSSRPESSGIRSITFHPDGRTLFCGLDENLKVYSWEPVVCHDGVDMGWSALGDLCISEGKLLGCSYYQNSVGVWVADISLIDPYGAGSTLDKKECMEKRISPEGSYSSERLVNGPRRSVSPDYEIKEIKNIYIDSACGQSVTAPRHGLLKSSKVVTSLDSDKSSDVATKKQAPALVTNTKSTVQAASKSFTVPAVVPWEIDYGKETSNSGKESITFSRTKPGMLLRPAHVRRTSNAKFDEAKHAITVESGTQKEKRNGLDDVKDSDFHTVNSVEERGTKPCDDEGSVIKNVMEKFEKVIPSQAPSEETNCHLRRSPNAKGYGARQLLPVDPGALNDKNGKTDGAKDPESEAGHISEDKNRKPCQEDANVKIAAENFGKAFSPPIASDDRNRDEHGDGQKGQNSVKIVRGVTVVSGRTRSLVESFERREKPKGNEDNVVAVTINHPPKAALDKPNMMLNSSNGFCGNDGRAVNMAPNQHVNLTLDQPQIAVNRPADTIPTQQEAPQISGRDPTSVDEIDIIENIIQTHDAFLSTVQSRLTKLQVVRHFWERSDIKGAIDVLKKLPDHSVQADVINVLMDKTDILTLDVFSFLLPVLTGLLDSMAERPANVSLEMLLKLVAVFGPVIRSTVSAPRVVGVDLHAEQRFECCNRCFSELQKIQKILPIFVNRRGGLLAKKAQELNLVLQEP